MVVAQNGEKAARKVLFSVRACLLLCSAHQNWCDWHIVSTASWYCETAIRTNLVLCLRSFCLSGKSFFAICFVWAMYRDVKENWEFRHDLPNIFVKVMSTWFFSCQIKCICKNVSSITIFVDINFCLSVKTKNYIWLDNICNQPTHIILYHILDAQWHMPLATPGTVVLLIAAKTTIVPGQWLMGVMSCNFSLSMIFS